MRTLRPTHHHWCRITVLFVFFMKKDQWFRAIWTDIHLAATLDRVKNRNPPCVTGQSSDPSMTTLAAKRVNCTECTVTCHGTLQIRQCILFSSGLWIVLVLLFVVASCRVSGHLAGGCLGSWALPWFLFPRAPAKGSF